MGLVEKVKAQATQVVGKAQEAGKAGQARLEALQARRRADGLLTELGAIAYRARTERVRPGDEQRSVDLVGQLREYETEYGSLDAPVAEHGEDGEAASST